MNLATNQKVNMPWFLVSLLDDWVVIRVQVIVVFLLLLVILVFVLVEQELRMKNDFALELIIAILKHEFKYLVVVIENLIKNLYLKPWLQNFEDLRVLYLHGIVSKFHWMETADSFKYQVRQMLIFSRFVEGYQPMIDLLLLIVEMVLRLDVSEQVLECTNHVTVESNSNHFD